VCRQREAKRLAKKGIVKVEEFGKYGILTEADIYTKVDEFHAWLVQEKMVNPETLSKSKEKEIFKTFMEVRAIHSPSLSTPRSSRLRSLYLSPPCY
jgi:hypothetical protein